MRLPATNSPIHQQFARFPATCDGMEKFHAVLDHLLDDALVEGHPIPTSDAIALRTAIGEIVGNIVEHACTGLPDAEVSVGLARYLDRVEATFEDQGVPFVKPEAAPLDELPLGGFGLLVARASLDVLDYTRVGSTNHWLLVRRFQGGRS